MAPAIRASTAVFALAACAAFGLALRDTLGDRRREAAPAGDPAPLLDSEAPAAIERDGAPSAAELAEAAEVEVDLAEVAEAEAAFASAAASRAGDPEAIGAALRSLLDPRVQPASWLSLADASRADRLGVLERLGIDVALREPRIRDPIVQIAVSGASCAQLPRAAAAAWGPGRRSADGLTWSGPDGAHRAVLRHCELVIERRGD